MHSSMKKRETLRLFSDLSFLIVSFYVAAEVSGHGVGRLDGGTIIFLLISWYFSTKATNLYDDLKTVRFVHEFLLLIPNILIQSAVLIIALFILNEHYFGRTFVGLYTVLLIGILAFKKFLSRKLIYTFSKGTNSIKNVLIVGTNEVGMSFYETLKGTPHYGYQVVGFLDQTKPLHLNGMYKGDYKEIERILSNSGVDEVIVALDEANSAQLSNIIRITDKYAVKTRIIPDYLKFNTSRFSVEMFGKYPLITVRTEPLEYFHWRLLKRALDFTLSFIVTVLILSWLLPIIALLIRLDSKGSVFFFQPRLGYNNKVFKCFKFRTMYVDIDNSSFKATGKRDNRVTKIGAFLRKTNLDEVPQVLNVLFGDMSLVGPRPQAIPFYEEYKSFIENLNLRHNVKPGVTGWAQVNGLRGDAIDPIENKKRIMKRFECDLWYIENWSFWLDIKIMFLTVWVFLKGDENAY
ncbi:undecaprenyl-phosphate glucose phosphotransferase [Flectobacillus sp. BAB-3569]|nr:undecaprenyl-phosphate glucose phosphotransferase [Flectobacillus sp. BAB-3569]